ncbi:hypothetical protein BGW36DRAFT_378185 [Talaromyces proteolyticus]|uniref:Pre-rRNA processing protein n=1 Tax=Talaromyces proteolyticus TaxID=1131652 RepID=A0AAD4KR56_9EURO|nr:uncharacterized protein BGW36DRAFT_378185 [Talaromyces proteolyticus]KAH8697198.1 hypothetical protein BGW36DRAFT_378185 [Talaromyces proteolyticus]
MTSDSTAMSPGRLSSDSQDISPHNNKHIHRSTSPFFDPNSESAPLLQGGDAQGPSYGTQSRSRPSSLALRSSHEFAPAANDQKNKRRWPIIVALSSLTVAVLLTLIFGFAAPAAVKSYAQQAVVFTPQRLSVDSATSSGVSLRVQGNVTLDGQRVNQKPVRDIGRFATWIAKEVELGESKVNVYLPEYDNVLVGTASLPAVNLNIREGHINHIDIITDLASGDVAGIRQVADDWMNGRLGQLRIKSAANVPIKSGIINIGKQVISTDLQLDNVPALPSISVLKLNIHENPLTPQDPSVAVEVSVGISNDYALSIAIPPLGFDILVPNCQPFDPYILVANATTNTVDVQPAAPAIVDVSGIIQQLPSELTKACPGKKDSPLDQIISGYMKGHQTTIYVRGADSPSHKTPLWMVNLLKSVTIPVPVTGHDFGQMIKNFSMTDVHFSMPDPFAEPNSPDSQPKVSAVVQVVVDLPQEMNFDVDIPRVRANVDVFYHGNKFGFLDLRKWQHANATRTNGTDSEDPLLFVTFGIKDGPLQVTDSDIFSEIVQSLLFGDKSVVLDLEALVDGKLVTTLGQFTIHDIPAQGSIKVNPPFGSSVGGLINPKVESLDIVHTTQSTVLVQATVNFTNPTPYSASIPFIDCLLLSNGTAIAHITGHAMSIVPGNNTGVSIDVLWSPLASSGDAGVIAGRKFLSNYISGLNTTLTLQSHKGSIPSQPGIGQALSNIKIDFPVPKLEAPDDSDDDSDGDSNGNPHFIKDATLHVWSSTSVFTLSSPLHKSTFYINSINATAFYNHTEPVGRIDYGLPFAVPPRISQTPRLPVELYLNGVGYEAVKRAFGGTLRMDARAEVGVTLGEYSTTVFYQGKGIGAKIRI